MKGITVSFLVGVFVGLIIFQSVIQKVFLSENQVLGDTEILRQPTQIPTENPTNKPTQTPSPIPTPTATSTPTPTNTPTPKVTSTPVSAPSHLQPIFTRFANEYEVESQLLIKIALCESRFNTHAINGDYLGLFQFGSQRWVDYRTQMGHDTNPELRVVTEESIKTAAYAISKGKLFLWPNCVN